MSVELTPVGAALVQVDDSRAKIDVELVLVRAAAVQADDVEQAQADANLKPDTAEPGTGPAVAARLQSADASKPAHSDA